MKTKLTLDMDALRVDTFQALPATPLPNGGTVQARGEPGGAVRAASVSYCQPCFTDWRSCAGPMSACCV